LEIAETLIRSNAVDIIAIDSVAALTPRAELEGDMGDSHVALQARLMSQALRKITGAISKSNCTVIFTNQLRMKVGVMFGNPEVTPGGKALKFYSSVRLEIRRIQTIKDGVDASGIKVRVKVVKNKIAPPFRVAEFDIMFSEGISKQGNLIDVGVEFDIIKKSGAWYEYSGTKLGQGREASKATLKENKKLSQEIESKIRAVLKGDVAVPMDLVVGKDTE
jgi:recombination protein RecA